jgi:hypothetical protein
VTPKLFPDRWRAARTERVGVVDRRYSATAKIDWGAGRRFGPRSLNLGDLWQCVGSIIDTADNVVPGSKSLHVRPPGKAAGNDRIRRMTGVP